MPALARSKSEHRRACVPPRRLVVAAVMVMGVCVAVASLGVAYLIARAWDPCAWVGAAIFILMGAMLGWLQYLAAFRGSRGAAMVVGALMLALAGFSLMALAITMVEFLLRDQRLPPWGFFAGFLAFAACTALPGWINFRGQWELQEMPAQRRRWQWSLAEMLGFMAASGLALAIITLVVRNAPPRTIEHAEIENPPFGIPRGAKDICWRQDLRNSKQFEFTLDEDGFRKWVEHEFPVRMPWSQQATLTSIDPLVPCTIATYKACPPLTDAVGYVSVSNGLEFTWATEGAMNRAVFDRANHRVYFEGY